MQRFRLTAVPLVFLLAACGDAASSDSPTEGGDETTLAGIGDGELVVPGAGGDDGSVTSGDPSGAFGDAPAAAPGLAPAPGPGGPALPATPGGVVGEPSAGAPAPSPADGVAVDPSAPATPLPPSEAPPAPVQPPTQSGSLTAGTWDDNQNFARFLDYRETVFSTQLTGLLPIDEDEHVAVQELGMGTPVPHQSLDISLVIDTTGSMADELAYLQTEFLALSQSIEAAYPESKQRWSLVVYKDVGDEYVARWFDFSNDPEEFRANLAAQSAGGGGDTPEAPDAAFQAMNQLSWRTAKTTARLAFWVADAPHHAENADVMATEIRTSQGLDIHIYPVASSGVDELTELSMRSAAQMTGGRYVFLTDDSGIGGAHKEPSIPCYFVTRLDHAILRMVDIELSGEYREPSADEVIRTGGDPNDGACTLDSGEVVAVY